MPDLNILTPGYTIGNSLYLITAMDYALVTSSSATQIVMTEGSRTFTLAGTGFTTTVIGGVTYINSGTVASITVDEGAGDLVSFSNLAMAGATLRSALRADTEGTNQLALENLFRGLTYTINGTPVADTHIVQTSAEGHSLALTRHNTYNLGDGNDTVTAAGSGNDTIFAATGDDSIQGNAGNDEIHGESGNDTLSGGTGNDSLYAGADTDSLYGGDGDDVLALGLDGTAYGGGGNDTVTGGVSGSLLYGDAGNE